MILVSGSTGNIGRELVKALTARGIRFRAMVRNEEHARMFAEHPGMETVIADFNDTGALAHALQGVEHAFLLTPSLPDAESWQRRFVDTAASVGVQRIVKLSQLHASKDSPVRFLRYHAAVEHAIRASGMDWTFLRPNLFMQGLLMFRESIIREGRFAIAAGTARISTVDVRDIAAAAAAALIEPGHSHKTYDLTGPEALTHTQMAAQLSRATGRSVRFVDMDEVTMRHMLLAHGLPEWMAAGLVEDYAHYRRGEAADVSSDVEAVTGMPARTFETFAQDYGQCLI